MRRKKHQAQPQGKRRRSEVSSWRLPSTGRQASAYDSSKFSSFQNGRFEAEPWVFLGEGRGAERQAAADSRHIPPAPAPSVCILRGVLNLHFLAEWPWDEGS